MRFRHGRTSLLLVILGCVDLCVWTSDDTPIRARFRSGREKQCRRRRGTTGSCGLPIVLQFDGVAGWNTGPRSNAVSHRRSLVAPRLAPASSGEARVVPRKPTDWKPLRQILRVDRRAGHLQRPTITGRLEAEASPYSYTCASRSSLLRIL